MCWNLNLLLALLLFWSNLLVYSYCIHAIEVYKSPISGCYWVSRLEIDADERGRGFILLWLWGCEFIYIFILPRVKKVFISGWMARSPIWSILFHMVMIIISYLSLCDCKKLKKCMWWVCCHWSCITDTLAGWYIWFSSLYSNVNTSLAFEKLFRSLFYLYKDHDV